MQLLSEQLLIRGEVLVDLQRAAERNQRNQIGYSHLLVNEAQRSIDRAIDIIGFHSREVEEEHHQSAVPDLLTRNRRGARDLDWSGGTTDGRLLGASAEEFVNILKIEAADLLAFAIFRKREVVLCEATNEITLLVAHHNIDQHQVAGDTNAVGRLVVLGRRLLRGLRRDKQRESEQSDDDPL